MADLSIPILDADNVRRTIDAHTQASGDYREAVTLGDASNAETARVLTGTPGASDAGVVVRPVGTALQAPAAAAVTQNQWNSSTVAQTVWIARPTRLAGSLFNGSTGTVYLKYAAVATLANADVGIPPGGVYELPTTSAVRITQSVSVIWDAAATGTLRTVEWTG